MRRLVWLGLLVAAAGSAFADQTAAARTRWAESPHGPMLERILPPGFEPRQLPQPESRGAQLTMRYCVQCHNLPNPAMHHAAKWPAIVERMVLRMQGRGNMGTLMSEMMAGVEAPSGPEAHALLAYLARNAQKPLDVQKYPEVNRPSGEAFRLACQQCHVLPDPQRHTATGVDEPRDRYPAGARRAPVARRGHQRLPREVREKSAALRPAASVPD
jgi:hypothetical protein